jgi:hypothetical protein
VIIDATAPYSSRNPSDSVTLQYTPAKLQPRPSSHNKRQCMMADLSQTPRLALARALLDCQALDKGDLALEAGDTVVIERQLGKDWLFGHVLSKEGATGEADVKAGLFPSSVVELIQGSEVQPGPLVFHVNDQQDESFSDSMSTGTDSRRPGSTRRGALYGGLLSPTAAARGGNNATKSIRGLWALSSAKASAATIAPSSIPALLLRQKDEAPKDPLEDEDEERILSIVVPFAERKLLLASSTELHSYYCVDIRTTHRVARVEKRFSDLRAFDAQLRALCPEVYTKSALENADALAEEQTLEEEEEVEDDDAEDESGAKKEKAQAPAKSASDTTTSNNSDIKIDVSLQHSSLMSAKRTSEVMERRRHAAARFLHLAFLARKSIADLLLAFLIGPLPGSRLDKLINGVDDDEATGTKDNGARTNTLSASATSVSSRGLLNFPSQAIGTRVQSGASARRIVPSVSLSANRDPSLPFLLNSSAATNGSPGGAMSPAGRAFPATALPAVPEYFQRGSSNNNDAFSGTTTASSGSFASLSLSESPVSFSVPPLLTSSDGTSSGASSHPASQTGGSGADGADSSSPLPALPPVFECTVTHRTASSSSTTGPYLEAGSSVPFSLDSLDAFDHLMEQGWAVIAEDDAAPSSSSFAAAGDPLDLPPALHSAAGLSASQEGSALEEPLLWAAMRKAGGASEQWPAVWPGAVPAIDPSAAGADAAFLAAVSSAPSSGPLSYPRTGQQLVISYTALVWDGGSTSGKVLECVERAVLHLNDYRKANETVPCGLHAALRRIQVGKTATVVLPDAAYGQEGIKDRNIPQAAHLVYARLKVHAIFGFPRPMPAAEFASTNADGDGSSPTTGVKARLGMVVPSTGAGAVDDDMLAAAHLILGSPSTSKPPKPTATTTTSGIAPSRYGPPSTASVASVAPSQQQQQYGSAHGMRAEKTASGVVMPSPAEAEAALRAYLASIGQDVPAGGSGDGGSGGRQKKDSSSSVGGGGFLRGLFGGGAGGRGPGGSTSSTVAPPPVPLSPAGFDGGVSSNNDGASPTGAHQQQQRRGSAAAMAPAAAGGSSTSPSASSATAEGSSAAAGKTGILSRLFNSKKTTTTTTTTACNADPAIGLSSGSTVPAAVGAAPPAPPPRSPTASSMGLKSPARTSPTASSGK